MMHRSAGVLFAAFATVLAGCGGSDQDTTRAARIVRADVNAKSGSCTRAGTATVSEEKVTLYSCTMNGVPPAYREFGQWHKSTQRYCYAVVGDYGISATTQFGAACVQK
jgi:hypothetical protein